MFLLSPHLGRLISSSFLNILSMLLYSITAAWWILQLKGISKLNTWSHMNESWFDKDLKRKTVKIFFTMQFCYFSAMQKNIKRLTVHSLYYKCNYVTHVIMQFCYISAMQKNIKSLTVHALNYTCNYVTHEIICNFVIAFLCFVEFAP